MFDEKKKKKKIFVTKIYFLKLLSSLGKSKDSASSVKVSTFDLARQFDFVFSPRFDSDNFIDIIPP